MLAKDIDFIRPKEVDLIALIESNSIDYMFQYKSVAVQHGLKYIALPDDINLSDPAKEEIYNSVSMDVTGDKPGTKIKVNGDYINYSITILNNAPHKDEAIDFLCFMLSDEGMDVFRKNGQDPIIPPDTQAADMLPIRLSKCIGASSMN
jgi:molybdate/tungstate transport system substrate-binding protein